MKTDNDIRHDIHNELARILSCNAEKLDVRVHQRVVTLTGTLGYATPSVRGLINETLVVALEAPVRSADAGTTRQWFPSS